MAWKMLTGFWNVHEVRERQEAKQRRCAEGVQILMCRARCAERLCRARRAERGVHSLVCEARCEEPGARGARGVRLNPPRELYY